MLLSLASTSTASSGSYDEFPFCASPEFALYKCFPVPASEPEDIFDQQALTLSLVQNVIIRGYNSILHYCGEVQLHTPKYAAFLVYCTSMNKLLERYIYGLEDRAFPYLRDTLGPLTVKKASSARRTLTSPFQYFRSLIIALQNRKTTFKSLLFRDAVYEMMEPLYDLLRKDSELFEPTRLRRFARTTRKKDTDFWAISKVVADASLSEEVPLMFVNGDSVNGSWFPELSTTSSLLKSALWKTRSEIWTFGSCDKNMKVKPLFMMYEPEVPSAPQRRL